MAENEKPDDGGRAFPKAALDPWGKSAEQNAGMTLRDYFAAKAMQGLMTAQDQRGVWQYGDEEDVAAVAYRIADAMIAARNQKPE